jgi:5-methylcytosine-specific restriction endonuclease McrA
MAFWKPEPWRKVKARRQRAEADAREACVIEVFRRHGSRCGVCNRPVKRANDPRLRHEFEVGHVHEIVPRSLGGDPHDPMNCTLDCYRCHARAHGLKVGGVQ